MKIRGSVHPSVHPRNYPLLNGFPPQRRGREREREKRKEKKENSCPSTNRPAPGLIARRHNRVNREYEYRSVAWSMDGTRWIATCDDETRRVRNAYTVLCVTHVYIHGCNCLSCVTRRGRGGMGGGDTWCMLSAIIEDLENRGREWNLASLYFMRTIQQSRCHKRIFEIYWMKKKGVEENFFVFLSVYSSSAGNKGSYIPRFI